MRIYQSAVLAILVSTTSVEAFSSTPLGSINRLQSPLTSTTRLYDSLDPLASEGDWTAYLDEDSTGLVYYFNGETGESMWEPPTSTFPSVKLSAEKRRIARERRKEFEASYAEAETKETATKTSGGGGGFFGFGRRSSETKEAVVEVEETVAVIEEEEVVVETKTSGGGGGGFFSAVFGGPKKENPAVEEEEVENGATELENDAGEVEAPTDVVEGAPRFSFGSIMGKPNGAKASAAPVVEEVVAEETPVVEETPAEPVVEEEAVEETTTSTPRKMDFGFPDIFGMSKAKEDDVLGEDLIIPMDKPISIEANFQVLPHPEKVSWGGEDAVFLKGRTFGVFDGVSGADKISGVALYSKTLASYMRKLVSNDGLTIDELIGFLTSAAEYADIGATGASTAVIGSIGEDGFLRALNLGDSVLLVLRDGKVVSRTKEIVHFFDCPYQLAEDSPDRPVDSTLLKTRVYPGDVIIAGSDGVFDNLADDEIIRIVYSCPEKSNAMARKIIEQSRIVSLDKEAPTPYAKSAKGRRGYDSYAKGLGGKVDDISCVVVRCT
mmetsp:Transcript_33782/g.50416  ORF Transcript_33782/g.50416 Transcript_33782/m.50416 type:complete len:551 (-) Transcript_33782:189-1841(-)